MLQRLLPERERPLVYALQTARTCLFVLLSGVVVILLIVADPDHHYANAFLTAAFNWAHAAFPTLIK